MRESFLLGAVMKDYNVQPLLQDKMFNETDTGVNSLNIDSSRISPRQISTSTNQSPRYQTHLQSRQSNANNTRLNTDLSQNHIPSQSVVKASTKNQNTHQNDHQSHRRNNEVRYRSLQVENIKKLMKEQNSPRSKAKRVSRQLRLSLGPLGKTGKSNFNNGSMMIRDDRDQHSMDQYMLERQQLLKKLKTMEKQKQILQQHKHLRPVSLSFAM